MTNKLWAELTDMSAEQMVGGTYTNPCYCECPPPTHSGVWIPPGLGKNDFANYKGQGAVKTTPPNGNWVQLV